MLYVKRAIGSFYSFQIFLNSPRTAELPKTLAYRLICIFQLHIRERNSSTVSINQNMYLQPNASDLINRTIFTILKLFVLNGFINQGHFLFDIKSDSSL